MKKYINNKDDKYFEMEKYKLGRKKKNNFDWLYQSGAHKLLICLLLSTKKKKVKILIDSKKVVMA